MIGQQKTSLGTWIAALALTVSLILVTLSCSQDPFVNHEIADVQHRLLVSRAPVNIDRSESGVKAEWSLEDSRTPSTYLSWAEQQLHGDYEITRRTEAGLILAKETEGDALSLTLNASPSASGVSVTITLEARPD